MPQFRETRFEPVRAFEGQERMLLGLRKKWMKIKNSKIFNRFKHSWLNPYHFGVKKIVADTPEQEVEIARQKGLGEYIDKNGVRCWTQFNGTYQEEYEQTGKVLRRNGDVSHMIPRDKNGNLDLMAEEPILISIIPADGISITGHVSMQYKDRVLNRVLTMEMDPLYPRYQNLSEYYFVYPSQLGIDPKKLVREMDKHNIKHGDDPYNIVSNNCAKNVAQILQKLGVKDIDFIGPDNLGLSYPTPGNNPFGLGMKGWCLKHGVPAKIEEVALAYKYHKVPDLDKREMQFSRIRERYNRFKNYLINKETQSKLSVLRNKIAQETDAKLGTNLQERKIPLFAKVVEKKVSDTILGKINRE
jgi:hypothetical protein